MYYFNMKLTNEVAEIWDVSYGYPDTDISTSENISRQDIYKYVMYLAPQSGQR